MAEGFKTFSYPGMGLVSSRGDRLRLSRDADVL